MIRVSTSSAPSRSPDLSIAACSRPLPSAVRPQRSPQSSAVESQKFVASFRKRLYRQYRPPCYRSLFRPKIARHRQRVAHRRRVNRFPSPPAVAVGFAVEAVSAPMSAGPVSAESVSARAVPATRLTLPADKISFCINPEAVDLHALLICSLYGLNATTEFLFNTIQNLPIYFCRGIDHHWNGQHLFPFHLRIGSV